MDILGDYFGKAHHEHILMFIYQLRLRTDVFDVVRPAIRDFDRSNEDSERKRERSVSEREKERERDS